jgi:hypothetical protein
MSETCVAMERESRGGGGYAGDCVSGDFVVMYSLLMGTLHAQLVFCRRSIQTAFLLE